MPSGMTNGYKWYICYPLWSSYCTGGKNLTHFSFNYYLIIYIYIFIVLSARLCKVTMVPLSVVWLHFPQASIP